MVRVTSPGRDPLWGTIHAVLAACCYSVFLYLLRRSGMAGRPIQNYFVVIASAAPVGALALSAIALGERPTVLQLLGCVLILADAYFSSNQLTGRRRGRAPDRPGRERRSP